MFAIWEKFKLIIKEGIVDRIIELMTNLTDLVQINMAENAADIVQTPQTYNSTIFNMVENLSENIVLPIALSLLTMVLCYELIEMFIDKNNMNDIDIWVFAKWIVKGWIGITLVTHAFDIANAMFEIGVSIAQSTQGIVSGELAQHAKATLDDTKDNLMGEEFSIPKLLSIITQVSIAYYGLIIVRIITSVVVLTRIVKMYVFASMAPLPLATMINREWGQTGNNYIKGLIATALSGTFMLIIIGIYGVFVQTVAIGNISEEGFAYGSPLVMMAVYSFVMITTLKKADDFSNSIINAH